jgi:hypothetical protein
MRGFHELMSLQDSLTLNENFSNNNLPTPRYTVIYFKWSRERTERKPAAAESTVFFF